MKPVSLRKRIAALFLRFLNSFHKTEKFSPGKVRKVLVYGYTGLGNFILYTPALKAIRNFLPAAQFTLLYGESTGCEEAVTGSALFDCYLHLDRNAGWKKRLKWLWTNRHEKYDLVISEFHNDFFFLALLTLLSGHGWRLGHVSSPGWKSDWDWLYDIPVRMEEDQHEIDRYLELAYALGIERGSVDKSPWMALRAEDRQFAEQFLISHGVRRDRPIVNVQMGTSPENRWKQWDLKKFHDLCEKILELSDCALVLHGAPGEKEMIGRVAEKLSRKPILAAGETTIKQAAAIVELSSLLVCNDSGLMHVAAAMGTPVTAIYGPTDYRRTAPYGKDHRILRKDLACSPCFRLEGTAAVLNCPYAHQCLHEITVDEVFESVKAHLHLKFPSAAV